MGDWALYLAFMIPPLVLGLVVQAWLKRTFAKFSSVSGAVRTKRAEYSAEWTAVHTA